METVGESKRLGRRGRKIETVGKRKRLGRRGRKIETVGEIREEREKDKDNRGK